MGENKSPGEKHPDSTATSDNHDGCSVVAEHTQEVPVSFGLLSLTGLGIIIGVVWPASGGSIQVAIFNGGSPGVLYEFIVVSFFYFFVAASLAELASAMPSSAGVYYWASVTPGKRYGRVVGFFAGWWNYLGWICAGASMAAIWSNSIIQIYALKHPDYIVKEAHVFVVFVISTWLACFSVCFAGRAMPLLNQFGIYWLLIGLLITVVVLVAVPLRSGGSGHATSSFVWIEWQADLGYPNIIVFLCAEEMPRPQRNVPLAMGLQVITGFITGFSYLIALMYSIHSYDKIFASKFPLAEIYLQATGSADGTICLLILMQTCIGLTIIGLYISCGRTLWTLSRDGATPWPSVFSNFNIRFDAPINATMASAVLVTLMGCIYVASKTAFNAIIGSYVLMSSSAYTAAVLPHLLTGRRNVVYGPIRMGRKLGLVVNAIASAYMVIAFVIYCLPYSLPVTAKNMNYACLVWGGSTLLLGIYWLWKGRHGYIGPIR
ncbi:cholin permease [Fusarium napiforme]|uniref:Cholin permease n=1 Tax=Fusarium napiforme TaxID=42672 RepID=A0A8H5N0W1_9HYPO|nr:cholin permease [Fusarium napiforme]